MSMSNNIFCKVRVAVLDKVTDFLLFLGKLVVTAAVALLSFLYFSGGINTTVSCRANYKPNVSRSGIGNKKYYDYIQAPTPMKSNQNSN